MNATQRPFRKSHNRLIAGVCGGIAEWLGWQPIAGRAFFSLMSVMSMIVPGIVVYVLLAFVMPEAGSAPAPAEDDAPR
jgi:phage shock protein C